MEPISRTRTRRLSGRSKIAPAASQNLVRAKKRLELLGFALSSEPAHVFGTGPARLPPRVSGSLSAGAIALPFELAPEDAVALGAALIASARDALGILGPSAVLGDDGEAVLALAEALGAAKGSRP